MTDHVSIRLAGAFVGALVLAVPAGGQSPGTTTYPMETMGTAARVVIATSDSAAMASQAERVHAVFAYVDSLMSNWTETSEVARINRQAASSPTVVHEEVAVLVGQSLRVWQESDRAFDITVEPLVRAWGFLGGTPHVPSEADAATASALVSSEFLEYDDSTRTLSFAKPGVRIDLGGIAKGYAVDRAADVLRADGVQNALVDISGNMFALGRPLGAPAWRIGIRDPRDRIPFFARLLVTDEAIATSGIYEQFVTADSVRYGHILDPRSGQPARGLISVTVVAPNATTADAWATAFFVLGAEDAKRIAKERTDLSVVLVEPGVDGSELVWVEEALRNQFLSMPASAPRFQIEYF